MELKNNNYCTLYIVRHGETTWNIEHIVQGHHDSPLTEAGVEQVKKTADELKGVKFDAIFASDSGRTQRTAEIIRLDRQLAINTSEALRERTFGSWEGKLGKDYRVNFQNVFDSLQKLSVEEQKNYKLADDIESDDELVTRFIVKLREIAVAYPGKTVLVVSHGGPIRNFLMHTGYAKYGELPTSSFSNAGYIKVTSDGIEFNIREVKGININ